jgi:hypothetical protein
MSKTSGAPRNRYRGKYAQVLPNLKALPPQDGPYQEKVEAAKRALIEQHDTLTSTALANMYADLDSAKDELSEEEKRLNLEMEAVSQLMQAAFEKEGVERIDSAEHGKNVTLQAEPYAQVTDADVFREWCKEQDLERKLSLPWATTNSITKQRLLDGLDPPPGVKAFVKVKPVVRKSA